VWKEEMPSDKDSRRIGLYIHIPFCRSKCLYCDFNSFSGKENLIEPYFQAVKKEILHYSKAAGEYSVKSVFFGGGTPSYVNSAYICSIMELCRNTFNVEAEAEVSLEANPGTVTFENLCAYKSAGINRLSMGLQAWQDSLLKQMGRIHSAGEFVENFKASRQAGFDNINVDLIFGLPKQDMYQWQETLENILALKPRHVSAYSLKIEEGTPFGRMMESGEIVPAEDELDREMYRHAIERMSCDGLYMYEISNFAQKGFECKHNMLYWKRGEYLGIGAGAHSYFKNTRYNNVYEIEKYIEEVLEGRLVDENHCVIDIREAMSEYMILGLRLTEGISLRGFEEEFGRNLMDVFGPGIERLINRGLLETDKDRIRLSTAGLDLANLVFEEFIQ
jgi:oxygen-independent coproporphyrinogen-3 oxidase